MNDKRDSGLNFMDDYWTNIPPATLSRTKVKSYTYPFRNVCRFTFTYHAIMRMQERQISLLDIAFILQHGRALLITDKNPSRVHVFLCPGEFSKRKVAKKTSDRLQGCVVIVERDRPQVVTVITNWEKWKRYVYYRLSLPPRGQLDGKQYKSISSPDRWL